MEILIFSLMAYGICNILIFGSIFETWRNFLKGFGTGNASIHKLFTCMMCLPTWVGFGLSALLISLGYSGLTPATYMGIEHFWLAIFLDGVFTSGAVWVIHNLEEMLERLGDEH